MEVGGLTETVEVTGASPIVDTVDDDSARCSTRPAAARAGRPPLHRHAYLAPGVSSSGAVARQPVDVRRQRPREPVRRRRRQHHQHRLRRGRLLLDHLRLARQRRHLRLHQEDPGQDRRLRSRVRPVDGRRRQRRHQERHQQPARQRCSATSGRRRSKATGKQIQTDERHGQHGGDADAATSASRSAARSSANRLFFFGAINPAWETRTFTAPAGFPLREPGRGRSRAPDQLVLRQGHLAARQRPPHRRLVLRRSGQGRHGPAAPVLAGPRTDTSAFSELEVRRPQPDGALRRRPVSRAGCSRHRSRARRTTDRRCRRSTTWRVTDTTVVPNVVTGGIGFYEAGNEGTNLQYQAKVDPHLRRPPDRGTACSTRTSSTTTSTSAPARRSRCRTARRRRPARSVEILADPNFGQIYRVTAPTSTGPRDDAEVHELLRAGHLARRQPPDDQPGHPLRAAEAGRARLDRLHVEEQLGAAHRRHLRHPRQRPVEALRATRAASTRKIPNDLAARALSADAGFTRADYFDAGLTQPIPERRRWPGRAPTPTISLPAGLGAGGLRSRRQVDVPRRDVVGFEFEAVPNINLGVRYIHRDIGRVLEDVRHVPDGRPTCSAAWLESVEYILTNPGPDTPVTRDSGLRHRLRGADPQLRRGRAHGRPAVREQLGAPGVVPLVAAARHLRGLLPRRQRPVGPGDHVALRLPDQRPELHGDRRAAVRLPRRHPLPRRARRGPAADSIGRTRSRCTATTRSNLGLNLGVGCQLSSGKPLTPLAANPNYDNAGEIPEGAARLRHRDGRRLQDAHAVRTTTWTSTPTTRSGSAGAAGSCCSPTCSTCSTCSAPRTTTRTPRPRSGAQPRLRAAGARAASRSSRRRSRSGSARGSSSRPDGGVRGPAVRRTAGGVPAASKAGEA